MKIVLPNDINFNILNSFLGGRDVRVRKTLVPNQCLLMLNITLKGVHRGDKVSC